MVNATGAPPAPRPSQPWTRWDAIILIAVTALGAALRFYKLGEVPPGFQFDEAFNAIDAKQVLAGNYPLFLPANGGREALYTYWQALIGLILGVDVYSLRLSSAIAGILTVPASFLLLRGLIRKQSRAIAAFTGVTLAISLWHIHFSRYGIRVIMMPLILCGALGLFWLGGHASTRRGRLLAYFGSGILVGITPWTHPAGRFVPFILIFYVAWILLCRPSTRRWAIDSLPGGLILTGVVAFLVFLPLGLEFVAHPNFFFGHASEVSIFAERVSGGDPWGHLIKNFVHVFGMFSFFGDVEWAHNLAGRPVFDPLMAGIYVIGLILWIWRLRKRNDPDFDAFSLLGIWSLVMLLPSVLSEAAPNYSRTLPSLPAVFTAAGLGLTWLATYRWPWRWLGPAMAAVVLFVSLSSTIQDYFIRFAQREEVYYLYDADKLEALDHLSQFTDDNGVYISQLWGDRHATVYLLRGRKQVGSFDSADTIVLPPPGQGAVYGFPAEQEERAQRLAALWPEAELALVPDKLGQPLLWAVSVPASALAGWPSGLQPAEAMEARFFDAPTFLGMQALENNEALALFWRSDGRTYRDLTTFIHLIDTDGRRVGQADKLPGNGSYLTPDWRVGERVVDRYRPEILDHCAGGEELRIQVGWYQYLADNARMPRTDGPGDSVLAGEMTLPIASHPAERLEPETILDIPLGDGLDLLGYSLDTQSWEPGAPLRLDLFWHGTADDADTVLTISLANGEPALLWQDALAPDTNWRDDEAICRRLRLRVPTDIESGSYRLMVSAGDETVDLGEIEIVESTRNYVLPSVANLSGARFGDEFLLHGFDMETDEDKSELVLALTWQALRIPSANYIVFVHLLDETGEIIAQSDAEPASGYSTGGWLDGEVVVDTHRLSLPEGSEPGTLRLRVGLYEPVSGIRLPAVSADGQSLPDDAVMLEP